MTIYRKALELLKDACHRYRQGLLGLGELKQTVWGVSQLIASADEQQLRTFLEACEGKLDMAQFTAEDVRIEVLKIVDAIEKEIEDWL